MQMETFHDARDLAQRVSKRVTEGAESAVEGIQNAGSDLLARAHDKLSPDSTVNVGDVERLASAVGGTLLIFSGLGRGSLFGGLMALAGGALVHRGVTGHCGVYERLDRTTVREMPQPRRMATLAPRELLPDGVLASAASGG